ncbi:pilus assembly protein PilF [Hylemonella gracilis]|jgi:tetratricopeptide (TPR) repeat protein|uniref:Pilus assembly protein PilF n=1 Tax=Hylemonella gracilis TaxID=80880 RepID=A0A4P6UKN3_9BURK|nr:CDC27 family protein [Hylemonella gracilis]QBK05752.1 pilus assembly protein PilF [Hylemonella gracilis]
MITSLRYSFLKWQAMALLVFNRREAALLCFAAMLALRPGDRYALASQAHVLALQGRRAEALHAQERLMETAQDLLAADWFNFGYLLEESGQSERAEQAWRRSLELDPRMDRAWYGLARVFIQAHRYDEAVAALKKNTELQPMSPFGWYQLARVHVDRHEPEEAVKIIRHLRGFEPKVAAQLERETGLRASPSF